MKLHEMKKKRAALLAESVILQTKLDNADAEFSAEDQVAVDKFVADLASLDAQIKTAETLASATASLTASAAIETVPATVKNHAVADLGGFADVGEFATAVKNAQIGNGVDDRLNAQAPTNSHQENNSDDGFMVPPQMRRDIWSLVLDEQSLFNMTTAEDTSGNQVDMLRDESTPWGGLGLQAYWTSELSQLTPSRLNTDADSLKLQKLYVFAEASDELMEDAPRLNSRLTTDAARAITWKLDEGIFDGSGSGMPEGILQSGALVTQAKETDQTADTVVAANVLKMYSRQLDILNSVWIANSNTFPQLATMTIGDQPMYTPPMGLEGAPFGRLMGRPIIYSDHSKTVGDVGDLVFASMRNYYMIKKASGVKFAESMHLFFDRDAMAFRWTVRVNGQTFMSAPVDPNNGTDSKSHFVALAERAA